MGMEIEAGQNALYTRAEGGLVLSWISTRGEWETWDTMGTVDIPADLVKQANDLVPDTYEAAKALDLEVGEESDFVTARAFLRAAADHGYGITGSY